MFCSKQLFTSLQKACAVRVVELPVLGHRDSLWDGEERVYGSFEPCWVNEVMCNLCFVVSRSTFYSKFAFAELL